MAKINIQSGGSYPIPKTGNINKVFTTNEWVISFDTNIGLWVNGNTLYIHDDELKEYIDKGLINEKALEYYDKKCEDLYIKNNDLFDKIKFNETKK